MIDPKSYVAGLFDLTGHVGIITGASRGLGMGQAKVLTDAGATVYNFSRSPHTAEEPIEGNLIDVACDVTDHALFEKELKKIIGKEGHLDFLVNNCGISYKARAEEFPEEKIDQILNLNLKTPLILSRLCYPYLKQSQYIGRIVTISSMAAYMGFSGVLPYDMSKSGVIGLTRGLAEEWKNDNILVNRKAAALSKPMLNRFGDPKEIGYMVLFLLSEASRYITGCDFPVDGGATSHGF